MHVLVQDQVAGDFGGAVRIGLPVTNQDLDIVLAGGGIEPVGEELLDLLDGPAVGGAEVRKRPGGRGHDANLDGPCGARDPGCTDRRRRDPSADSFENRPAGRRYEMIAQFDHDFLP